tara:strand:+ start:1976 stop:2194 length:219 start_codon:yes stop_codon:yes gene_type:complete
MGKVNDINTRAPYSADQLQNLQSNMANEQHQQATRRYIALKVAERREFRRDMVFGFCLTMGAIVCLYIGWNI